LGSPLKLRGVRGRTPVILATRRSEGKEQKRVSWSAAFAEIREKTTYAHNRQSD
jgi:hypothetical protein